MKIRIGDVLIKYNDKNVKIVDSYKITDKVQMLQLLIKFKLLTNYKTKRSLNSWILEWKSHNRMYILHIFRIHTKDCDLEENERLYRRLIYNIVGR